MEKIISTLKAHGVNVIAYGLNTFTVDNVNFDTVTRQWQINKYVVQGREIVDTESGEKFASLADFLGY